MFDGFYNFLIFSGDFSLDELDRDLIGYGGEINKDSTILL
jgi:hypothetical protein